MELAYVVAYLRECTWADRGFAGMAHVVTDRIDALRDSRVIVDSTSAPSHSKSVFNLEAYRSSSRMDAMMFAPQADLYFIDEGSDLWIALLRFDCSSSFLNPFRYSLYSANGINSSVIGIKIYYYLQIRHC